MSPESGAVGVCAGIARRAGRVLVCRRRDDQSHPGRWEFPGGKIEPGETPQECLRRELEEELGVDAVVGPLLTRYRHAYPAGPVVDLWFFAIEGYRGHLRNRVFAELRWADLDELESLDLLEADRPIVALLRGR